VGRVAFLIGLVQKIAQVEEMLLVGAALGEIGAFPFVDEVLRGHGAAAGFRSHDVL